MADNTQCSASECLPDSDTVELDSAPIGIKEQLSDWKLGTGQITHCMITLDNDTMAKSSCSSENMTSRYCWFGAMDDKGSVPDELKKVIYLLHMVQKYYDNTRVGIGRDGDRPFIINKAEPFSAHTCIEQRSCFHKNVVNCDILSIPLFKLRIYVEQGVVGGDINKDKFFAFLVVDVPLTFDLVDSIERSCNRAGSDRGVCDEMKKMWVDVACVHNAYGAYGATEKEEILNVNFKVFFVYFCMFCVY